MANEIDLSKLITTNLSAKSESYQRSAHNDFANEKELKERKFSGWRMNSVTRNTELWVEGEIKGQVTPVEISIDPLAADRLFRKTFKLED